MKHLLTWMLMAVLMVGLAACSGNDQAEESASAESLAKLVPERSAQADTDKQVAACRAATQKLGGALKSALQGAMKEGGPAGALDVCHDEAEVIAERICEEEGLTVGRTSRRFRNPGNAPDEWEMAGLEAFEVRIAAGELPQDLEMWTTVTSAGGGRTFRYLKAIPTGPLCLKCHGSELAPDLDQKLVELYPDDHARGFAIGDMRGAFTVKIDLPRAGAPGG